MTRDSLVTIDFSDHIQIAAQPIDEAEILRWFDLLARERMTGAIWRVTHGGRVMSRSRTWAPPDRPCWRDPKIWDKVRDVLGRLDPPAAAVAAAHAAGRKVYLWITLFDQAIWRAGVSAVDPFFAANPLLLTVNRRGGPWLGVPSYAYPESRAHLLDLVRECAAYGPDGIFLCTRTHAYLPWGWRAGQPDSAFPADDRYGYGFDAPVVEEFQNRYGVDITRVDFDEEPWHRLKGEFFTAFLREIRAAVPREQELWLNIHPDRYTAVCLAKRKNWIYKDWETWKKQRLLTGLSLHLERSVTAELPPLAPFVSLADPSFPIRLWLNTAQPPLKSPEDCRHMAAAVRTSPFSGVLWHQMSDWYYENGRSRPDRLHWEALTLE